MPTGNYAQDFISFSGGSSSSVRTKAIDVNKAIGTEVTLDNASDYRTIGLYRTPNPGPFVS